MVLEETLANMSDLKNGDELKSYRSRLEQIYSDYKTNFDLVAAAVSNFERHEKIIKRLLVVCKRNMKTSGLIQTDKSLIEE